MLNCIREPIKNFKKIKTRSVRKVNLVEQVKTLVFLLFKLDSSSNWTLKCNLVIIWTWALQQEILTLFLKQSKYLDYPLN